MAPIENNNVLNLQNLDRVKFLKAVIDIETPVVDESKIKDVLIDMDGVLANFQGSPFFKKTDKVMRKPPRMYEAGFFETLEVLPGARWAIRVLLKNPFLRVQILTKPVTKSYICYAEKVAWIAKNFPELLEVITITHDKSLLAAPGRILIDDYPAEWKAGWEAAGGRFIHFQTEQSEQHWIAICRELAPDCFVDEGL